MAGGNVDGVGWVEEVEGWMGCMEWLMLQHHMQHAFAE